MITTKTITRLFTSVAAAFAMTLGVIFGGQAQAHDRTYRGGVVVSAPYAYVNTHHGVHVRAPVYSGFIPQGNTLYPR